MPLIEPLGGCHLSDDDSGRRGLNDGTGPAGRSGTEVRRYLQLQVTGARGLTYPPRGSAPSRVAQGHDKGAQ